MDTLLSFLFTLSALVRFALFSVLPAAVLGALIKLFRLRLSRVAPTTTCAVAGRVKNSAVVAGMIVTAIVALSFFLLYWNRFAGLRSGDGGFTAGTFLLAGIRPYRDYFCPVPPLNILKSAAVLYLFGNLPIMIRAFAVFERVVLSVLLYSWLIRLFRARDAALAALVTVVVSAGDISDPISSYNHYTILLAIACGYVASFTLDRDRSECALVLFAWLSGVFAFLCLATKQTIGIGITLAVPVVVAACLLQFEGVRKAAIFIAGYAVGWAIPAIALMAWLAQLSILREFFQQVFVHAPAAKASHLGDFLIRAVRIMNNFQLAALIGFGALLLSWRTLCKSGAKNETRSDSVAAVVPVLLIGVISIAVAAFDFRRLQILTIDFAQFASALLLICYFFLYLHGDLSRRRLLVLGAISVSTAFALQRFLQAELISKSSIYFTFFTTGLLLVHYVYRYLRRSLSRRQSQLCLAATVSFVVAFMLSLSWPAFEAMVIPGLGLLIAAILDDTNGWRKAVVYTICGVLLFGQTRAKLQMPFGFAGWSEPAVETATARSELAEMKGFVLPESTVRFIDTTVRIIREHSSPQDTIFTYPELGLFYGISGRRFPTFSGSHNLDVVPDELAKADAGRVLRGRPAVLIYGRQSEQFLRAEEELWRKGGRSGEREIIAAVERLAEEYHLVATFNLPPYNRKVSVYVRP